MADITDNPDKKRFEYNIDGQTAIVEYIIVGQKRIFLTHTEVPKKLQGQGIAFDMIGQVLTEVENRGLELVPLCPTVATYLRRNPEWQKLLAKGFNV